MNSLDLVEGYLLVAAVVELGDLGRGMPRDLGCDLDWFLDERGLRLIRDAVAFVVSCRSKTPVAWPLPYPRFS